MSVGFPYKKNRPGFHRAGRLTEVLQKTGVEFLIYCLPTTGGVGEQPGVSYLPDPG
jgi:hypothetical protein